VKRGDIVIVPFPFTDLTAAKIRPALVVSGDAFNTGRNVLLVAISTKQGLPDFSIPITSSDLVSGELKKQSFFRLQNFFSFEKRLIIKSVARITTGKQKEIEARLQLFLH
jgi:mRNA interferase MazF